MMISCVMVLLSLILREKLTTPRSSLEESTRAGCSTSCTGFLWGRVQFCGEVLRVRSAATAKECPPRTADTLSADGNPSHPKHPSTEGRRQTWQTGCRGSCQGRPLWKQGKFQTHLKSIYLTCRASRYVMLVFKRFGTHGVPPVPAHIDQRQRRQRAVSVNDRPQNPVLHDDCAIILWRHTHRFKVKSAANCNSLARHKSPGWRRSLQPEQWRRLESQVASLWQEPNQRWEPSPELHIECGCDWWVRVIHFMPL